MLETFLTVVFVFILIYYAFRLFFRYGLPWLLARLLKKRQRDFFGQAGGKTPSDKKKEGEVKVRGTPKEKKKDNTDFGEYVDYEDVDE